MPPVTPCLWFDSNAEEAVRFYTSTFKNSKITGITRYGDAGAKGAGRPKGSVMTVTFELNGQPFMALNGGPHFKMSPAISFIVKIQTQQELDEMWEKLGDGGQQLQCGWLTDRFGVSWQIVPAVLGELMLDKDPAKSDRVMKALLTMRKLDIAALMRAYEQP